MPSHLCSNRLVVILLRHYCSTNLHEYWRRMRYLHMYKKWKCCRLVHGQTGRLRKVTICTITAPNNSVLCWSFVYLMKNKWINKRYKIYCRQNHFTLIASLTLDFHHTKYVRIMLLVFGRIRNCFFFYPNAKSTAIMVSMATVTQHQFVQSSSICFLINRRKHTLGSLVIRLECKFVLLHYTGWHLIPWLPISVHKNKWRYVSPGHWWGFRLPDIPLLGMRYYLNCCFCISICFSGLNLGCFN